MSRYTPLIVVLLLLVTPSTGCEYDRHLSLDQRLDLLAQGRHVHVAPEEMMPEGYLKHAVPAARRYRRGVEEYKYRQHLGDDWFRRRIRVSTGCPWLRHYEGAYEPFLNRIHLARWPQQPGPGNIEIIRHELCHATQRGWGMVTGMFVGLRALKTPSDQRLLLAPYDIRPHEVEAWLATAKQQYFEETGRIIDSPAEGRRAIRYFANVPDDEPRSICELPLLRMDLRRMPTVFVRTLPALHDLGAPVSPIPEHSREACGEAVELLYRIWPGVV